MRLAASTRRSFTRRFADTFRFLVASTMGALLFSLASTAHAQIDKEEFEAILRADPLLDIIAVNFKADFDAAVQKVLDDPSEENAQAIGGELTSGLRKANATNVFAAPADIVKNYVTEEIAFLQMIKSRSGTDLCAAYLNQGAAALSNANYDLYAADLSNGGVRVFSVIVAGRGKPPLRTEPTDADWTALVKLWQSRGVPDAQFAAVASGGTEGTTADFCDGFISFYGAIAAMDGETGARLQTNVIYTVAAN